LAIGIAVTCYYVAFSHQSRIKTEKVEKPWFYNYLKYSI
jgi:hypothetical protein